MRFPSSQTNFTRYIPLSAGGEVVVTVAANGIGAFGAVVETLPAGFTYVSSSLADSQVSETGQNVRFTLLGDNSFTYTVTAPSAAGSYSFSGVLTTSDGQRVPVGGALSIAVGEDSRVSRYGANGNGAIDRSEVITAINDYLFGEQGVITRAEVIELINLYLFG